MRKLLQKYGFVPDRLITPMTCVVACRLPRRGIEKHHSVVVEEAIDGELAYQPATGNADAGLQEPRICPTIFSQPTARRLQHLTSNVILTSVIDAPAACRAAAMDAWRAAGLG